MRSQPISSKLPVRRDVVSRWAELDSATIGIRQDERKVSQRDPETIAAGFDVGFFQSPNVKKPTELSTWSAMEPGDFCGCEILTRKVL